ncbi:MAG: hypothetical protein Q8P13_02340 [bacterium]|nr:hypothetical protein [bacterium]
MKTWFKEWIEWAKEVPLFIWSTFLSLILMYALTLSWSFFVNWTGPAATGAILLLFLACWLPTALVFGYLKIRGESKGNGQCKDL